jgi:fibronectin-binding autotransporter adhesin
LNVDSITTDRGSSFTLSGGTATANSLTVTNGALGLFYGSLTTYNSTTTSTNAGSESALGSIAGTSMSWTMLGGTNTGGGGATGRLIVGKVNGSTGYLAVVGNDTLLRPGEKINVGENGFGTMVVSNGAEVLMADSFIIGNGNSASNCLTLVSDSGTIINARAFTVGDDGAQSLLVVSNGGDIYTALNFNVGQGTNGHRSKAIITDSGSTITSDREVAVRTCNDGLLMITNGASVILATGSNLIVGANEGVHIGLIGLSNQLVVAGSGSLLSNATGRMYIGSGSAFNQLTVEKGATLYMGNTSYVGAAGLASAGNSNIFRITDTGTVATLQDVYIGDSGNFNEMIISNGARVVSSGDFYVSEGATSTGNVLKITGTNSFLQAGIINVGANASTEGAGTVLVENFGILEATGLVSGSGGTGTISNRGSIYQFTTAIPTITTNTVDSIILTNGILSFKGVTSANINTASIARITYQGENTFQLNNSTGSLFSAYTFGTNNGAAFQHFTMVDSGTRWQATNTTLNTGGLMTFSNTTATIFGTMTNNAGTMRISATNSVNTSVTFENSLVISGTGNGSGAIQNLRATNTITAPMTLMGNSTISSASGKLTVAGAISNGIHTLTVGGAGNVTLAAPIDGSGGLALNGGGTVIISNTSANTFTGATTITNTTVTVTKAGALGATASITISSSGTLLLDGAAADRIGNSSAVTLEGGAITVNNKTETVGTLTLAANSTITLNYDGTIGDLTFSDTSYTGGTLTITGWNGTSAGGGDDRIFFTANAGGANMLNNITFQGFAPGAQRLGSGEIIPLVIPEPSTVVVGSCLVILFSLGYLRRKLEK